MKRGITSVLLASLLILSVTMGKTQQAYASDQSSVREAESGDKDNLEGKSDVDVSGEMKKTPSTEETTETSTVETKSISSTQIGGKLIDTSGKNIKTGDVLTSVKTLAILFLGVGCVFLIMRKKKNRDSVEEQNSIS